uniref:Uncharacterized protein n=1 Tax=Parascaris equorum TaxID=6256 RepID=A0A914RDH8_PAREQ
MPNQLTDMAAHMQEHHTQTQPSATIGGSAFLGIFCVDKFVLDFVQGLSDLGAENAVTGFCHEGLSRAPFRSSDPHREQLSSDCLSTRKPTSPKSVPLIANDSDFDEPEGEAVRRSTSRNTTSQRSDAFPRIRRRLIERSTNDAQSWCANPLKVV